MDALTAKIQSEIRNRGAISFARFMELALYCPVYGFYEKEGDNIGSTGDYYTSVSVGSLFGRMLALQFAHWFSQERLDLPGAGPGTNAPLSQKLQLVEAGAHRGDLAKDILQWFCERQPETFKQLEYCIMEPSASHQAWQERTLGEFRERVRWARAFADLSSGFADGSSIPPFRIIFSNELIDAMPVHRLGWDASKQVWFEWGVANHGHGFAWVRIPPGPSPARLAESRHRPVQEPSEAMQSLRRVLDSIQLGEPAAGGGPPGSPALATPSPSSQLLDALPDGFTTEVSPAAERWWREAAGAVGQGKLLTIDYGHTFEEFFMPERAQGTLRAYRRHRLGNELLASPGQQDITSDVNFTVLKKIGESAGLTTDLLASQEQFLTMIAARIWTARSEFGPWTPEHTRQFQTLTHPEHLGRAFKVLVQSAGR